MNENGKNFALKFFFCGEAAKIPLFFAAKR
jgi:hypothetical protein